MSVTGVTHAELDFQIALNLLLWGEAANLRLCPEFLCWAYHKTAKRLRDAIADKEPKQLIRYIGRFCFFVFVFLLGVLL